VDWIRTAQQGSVAGPCEHSNASSGSIKGEGFLEYAVAQAV
jgi:hypothetical protein